MEKVQLLEGLEVWRDLPMNLETSTMASRGSEKGKELKFEERQRLRPYVSKPVECERSRDLFQDMYWVGHSGMVPYGLRPYLQGNGWSGRLWQDWTSNPILGVMRRRAVTNFSGV